MLTAPRKAVKRSVAALILGLIAVWLGMREPPEIHRSRALRLGMTESEVKAAMGVHRPCLFWTPNGDSGMLFGRLAMVRSDLRRKVSVWLGLQIPGLPLEAWPVRVRFDQDGRVDRIERDNEVESIPQ